jgi:hypothetical protein
MMQRCSTRTIGQVKMVGEDRDVAWTDAEFEAWAEEEVDLAIKHGLVKPHKRAEQIADLTAWWESKDYVEIVAPLPS